MLSASPTETKSWDDVAQQLTDSHATFTGVTIVTHGFQLFDSDGDSLLPLGKAIQNQALAMPNATDAWLIDSYLGDSGNTSVVDMSDDHSHLPEANEGGQGEIVLVYDWAAESNLLSAGWTSAAGDALASLLVKLNFVDPANHTSLPLHFIGHSFGCAVTSEAVEKLSQWSIHVDQVTYLDPHDFNEGLIFDAAQAQSNLGLPQPTSGNLGDGYGVSVWNNVEFTDVYYETRGSNDGSGLPDALVPTGRPIPGAYNKFLRDGNELPETSAIPIPGVGPYGLGDASGDHSYVWSGYYLASVTGSLSEDLNNNGILDPGEDLNLDAKITVAPDSETSIDWGVERAKTGFAYTRIAREILSGLGVADPDLPPPTFFGAPTDSENPQDHKNSSQEFVSRADGQPLNSPNSISLTNAKWVSPESPLAISNGEFEFGRPINTLSDVVPGWSDFGGGGTGSVSSGVLKLDSTSTPIGESRTHNYLYVPENAAYLQFSANWSGGGSAPGLKILIGNEVIGTLGPQSASAPFLISIPTRLRNNVQTLTFQSTGGGTGGTVSIDNITFHQGISVDDVATINLIDSLPGTSGDVYAIQSLTIPNQGMGPQLVVPVTINSQRGRGIIQLGGVVYGEIVFPNGASNQKTFYFAPGQSLAGEEVTFNYTSNGAPHSFPFLVDAAHVAAALITTDESPVSLNVMRLQQRLNYLGYVDGEGLPLAVDGIKGPKTTAALTLFQTVAAAAGTRIGTFGKLDNNTLRILNSSAAPTWRTLSQPTSTSPHILDNGDRVVDLQTPMAGTALTATELETLVSTLEAFLPSPSPAATVNSLQVENATVRQAFLDLQPSLSGFISIAPPESNLAPNQFRVFLAAPSSAIPRDYLSSGERDTLTSGIQTFVDQVPDLAALGELETPLPLIGATGETPFPGDPQSSLNAQSAIDQNRISLADASGLSETLIGDVLQPIRQFLSQFPDATIAEIEEFLQETFGTDSLSVSKTVNDDEISFSVGGWHQVRQQDRSLVLGDEAGALGLKLPSSVTLPLTTTLDLSFTIGLDLTPGKSAAEAFFLSLDDLQVTSMVDVTDLNFDVDLGFLGLQVNNGSIHFAASVDLDQPVTLTMESILDGSGLGSLTLLPASSLSVNLPTTVRTIPGASFLLDLAGVGGSTTITMTSGNLFSGSLVTVFGLLNEFEQLAKFSGQGLTGLMSQLGNWLNQLNASSTLAGSLPFVQDLSLGDLLQLKSVWTNLITSKLQNATQDVDTLQEVIGLLSDTVAGIHYNANTRQLTFDIDLTQVLADKTTDIGFQTSLGSLAEISSSSQVTLKSDLQTHFSFGIDLNDVGTLGLSLTSATPVVDLNDHRGARFNAVGSPDLRITLSDGTSAEIALGGALTLGDVLARLNAPAFAGKFQASINSQGSGFVLVDSTNGPGSFTVEAINNSFAGSAGLGLGLLGTIEFADADGKRTIQGGVVNGDSIGKHFYLLSDAQHVPTFSGRVVVSAPDIDASARFGFADVQIVNGHLSDTEVTFSVILQDLVQPTDGRIYLQDLIDGLQTPADFLDATLGGSTSTTNSLVLPLQASILGQPVVGTPTITATWSNLFDADGNFDLGSLNLSFNPDMNSLLAFESMTGVTIENALQQVTAYLSSLNAISLLSEKLPILNQTLGDLLGINDRFVKFIDDFASSPTRTLDALEGQLQTALNNIFSGSGIAAPTVDLAFDTSGGGQALKIGLVFAVGFDTQESLALDLSPLSGTFGSLIDVKGTGQVNVKAGASLTINLGIDLVNPSSPRVFLYGDTGAELSANVRGENLHFSANLGPLGIGVGNGTNNGSVYLNQTGSSAANTPDASIQVQLSSNQRNYFDQNFTLGNLSLSAAGGLAAQFPLYLPGQGSPLNLGINVGDLTNISSTTTVTAPSFDSLVNAAVSSLNLTTNMSALSDGLNGLFDKLQKAVDAVVFASKLPLIGDQLKDAAQFIDNLRHKVVDNLEIVTNGAKSLEYVRQRLYEALGPGGLNWLVHQDANAGSSNPNTSSAVVEDILIKVGSRFITLVDNSGIKEWHYIDDNSLVTDPDSIEFVVQLHQNFQNVSIPIDFDIGLSAIGLNVDGGVNLQTGFDLKLGFGIDTNHPELGVFLDTSFQDELTFGISATLPAGFHATGNLGFLQVDVTDDPDHGSSLSGTFAVDLQDSDGDDRLVYSEFTSATTQIEQLVNYRFDAMADINLVMVAGFGANANFPSVDADFNLDWTFDTAHGATTPTIAFNNVRIDVGQAIQGFVSPIIDKVNQALDPVRPLLEVLATPLPVISQFNGRDVTLLDIAVSLGYVSPGAAGFIDAAHDLLSLADSLRNFSGTIFLGSFVVSGVDLTLETARLSDGSASPTEPADLSAAAGLIQQSRSISSEDGQGLRFPILDDPMIAFGLLLGQDVDLFTYDMPSMTVTASYISGPYPIYPPFLSIAFGGEIGATVDLNFGYDTRGLKQYSQSGNFGQIANGFYFDTADAAGRAKPFATLFGGIEVYAFGGVSLDFGVASATVAAGVIGGLYTEIDFTLHDPNSDGKVYIDELGANLSQGIGGLFDIDGRFFVGLSAFLKIDLKVGFFSFTLIDVETRLAEITIASFSHHPSDVEPPPLAHMDNGTLILNTTEGDDSFSIRAGANSRQVFVTSQGTTQTYDNVDRIYASAGGGNDEIIVDQAVILPVELHGGSDNDHLVGGGGTADLYGDEGDDDLVAGSRNSRLYGGTGKDRLTGREGDDTLDGGDNNDILFGGSGSDRLIGGSGNDRLYGEAGDDNLSGGAGDDLLEGGDGIDTLSGDADNDLLRGGDGADLIYGGSGDDQIEGGLGNDEIHGGSGNDLIDGGANNDTIYGDENDDLIVGGTGSDVIDGGSGDDTLMAGTSSTETPQAVDTVDIIRGGSGNDTIYGEYGADQLSGDDGDDLIYGYSGNDAISGGKGNDRIFGASGADQIQAGEGDDYVDAGIGNDVVSGDAGNDLIYGQAGKDQITGGTGNDRIYGGSENDVIHANEGDDFVDAGSGDDEVYGDAGRDKIFGMDGKDLISGGEDDDEIYGGQGDDFLIGNTGDDLIYGEAGRDILWGGNAFFALADFNRDDLTQLTIAMDFADTEQDYPTGYTPPAIVPVRLGGESVEGDFNDGNDTLVGGTDDQTETDWLFGGGGQDDIYGGGGADYADGGSGNDEIYGELGDDVIRGGSNNDVLHGNAGIDQLYGDSGTDNLFADAGSRGFVSSVVSNVTSAVTLNLSIGTITVSSSAASGNLSLADLVGDINSAISTAGLSSILFARKVGLDRIGLVMKMGHENDAVTLTGATGLTFSQSSPIGIQAGQRLWGGDEIDYLWAYAGSTDLNVETAQVGDELHGGSGGDWLYGNIRQDRLFGDSGNDTLLGDYLRGPTYATNTYADRDGAADTLFGDTGEDKLYGGGGDDTLWGGADSDWLEGQAGNDRLYGGSGNDLLVLDTNTEPNASAHDIFDGHGGNRYLGDAGQEGLGIVPIYIDTLQIEGTAIDDGINLSQNSLGQLRVELRDLRVEISNGTTKYFLADWRDASDKPLIEQFHISGLMGNDTIKFLSDADVVARNYVGGGGALDVSDLIGLTNDFVTQIDGGPGQDTLWGTAGRDRIDGGFGSDTIYGLGGDDQLWGDGGPGQGLSTDHDIIYGGQGNDDVLGGQGTNELYAWSLNPDPNPNDQFFGVYVDPLTGALYSDDGNGQYSLEDTGLNR
ncbi:MAG: peptidoglycan-binding protein, partial [Planctomycetaceae bacterium]|nr:peptidoglycan-binding protein [Planctomycetaceae bacterium]